MWIPRVSSTLFKSYASRASKDTLVASAQSPSMKMLCKIWPLGEQPYPVAAAMIQNSHKVFMTPCSRIQGGKAELKKAMFRLTVRLEGTLGAATRREGFFVCCDPRDYARRNIKIRFLGVGGDILQKRSVKQQEKQGSIGL